MNNEFTSSKSQTDWQRLDAMTDEDIDFFDCPEITPEKPINNGFAIFCNYLICSTFNQCHQRLFYSCATSGFDGYSDCYFVKQGISTKQLNQNGCCWQSKVFFSNRYFTFNWGCNGCLDGGGDSSGSGILGN
ncbi:MAG: hypothetical protein JGK20_10230 [Microcoleus sp. PH2017_05_CCC_O_A]|nr:hypothetical protein [Microcoleus sp. PH2017_05_CCC_O_A]